MLTERISVVVFCAKKEYNAEEKTYRRKLWNKKKSFKIKSTVKTNRYLRVTICEIARSASTKKQPRLQRQSQVILSYDGKSISKIDKYTFRSRFIGVVFQSFNLITKYTALENVILSMDVSGAKIKNKKQRALELLDSVGLDEDEANRRVLKLSGGQQQRVAIARALSYDPDIILADEPTGNLDRDTQKEIMDIFRELTNQGKCVILVSHSPDVAEMCDERYELTKISGKKKRT